MGGCGGAGRRDDRRQARMKYLVEEWGVPKFRSVVEQYYGKKFEPFRLPPALGSTTPQTEPP